MLTKFSGRVVCPMCSKGMDASISARPNQTDTLRTCRKCGYQMHACIELRPEPQLSTLRWNHLQVVWTAIAPAERKR